jgi:hypothetical protein
LRSVEHDALPRCAKRREKRRVSDKAVRNAG